MGLLGGDCPGVARGGPPTRAKGRGTSREARQPLIWQDLAFGCQPEGGQEWDGRVGRARGRRWGSHPGTEHWEKGPRAGRGSPPIQYQGTWSPCRKTREGGQDGQQAAEQPLPPAASPPGRPFPSLGWGAEGSTLGMGRLGGAEGQGGRQGGVPGTGWHPGPPCPPASGAQ